MSFRGCRGSSLTELSFAGDSSPHVRGNIRPVAIAELKGTSDLPGSPAPQATTAPQHERRHPGLHSGLPATPYPPRAFGKPLVTLATARIRLDFLHLTACGGVGGSGRDKFIPQRSALPSQEKDIPPPTMSMESPIKELASCRTCCVQRYD